MIQRIGDIDHLDLKPHEVLEVFRSINENMMSAESYPTQLSEAAVIGARRGDRIRIFVHYYLAEDKVGLLYGETDSVTVDTYQAMRNAAIDSVEAMGFLLENLNFRKRNAAEQARILAELPAFGGTAARVRIGGVTASVPDAASEVATAAAADPETIFILDDEEVAQDAPPASVAAAVPATAAKELLPTTVSLAPDTWKVLFRLIASL